MVVVFFFLVERLALLLFLLLLHPFGVLFANLPCFATEAVHGLGLQVLAQPRHWEKIISWEVKKQK